MGAEEVTVDGIRDEEERIQKEGGPYADALKVKLPEDPEKRKSLFDFVNSEVDDPEFQQEDTGQKEITLWWD